MFLNLPHSPFAGVGVHEGYAGPGCSGVPCTAGFQAPVTAGSNIPKNSLI